MFQKKKLKLQILLIALSLLATLWIQIPRLVDGFRVDEDFRSFYWMNKFQESGLYPDDQLRGHTYVTLRLPWGDLPLYFYSLGYNLLFYAASFFVSPVSFSKLLPFLLLPIAVWYLFEYGRSVAGPGPATVLAAGFVVLNLGSATSLSVTSGFQRAFACPLMIALLYYLSQRQPLAIASTVSVAALFYPPVFLLGLATSGLFFLSSVAASPPRLKGARKGLIALSIAFCVGALVLSPVIRPRIQGALRPRDASDHPDGAVTRDRQILNHPNYQPGGRNPLFVVFPIIGRGGLVNKAITALHLLILISISSLIFAVRRPPPSLFLPRELWCTVSASLALFAAAWASIFLTDSFLLYLPSRYTRVGLFLFFSIFVFLNICNAIEEGVHLIRRSPNVVMWFIPGVEAVALALIFLYPSDGTRFMGVNMKWLLAPASLLLGVLAVLSFRGRSAPPALTRPKQTIAGRLLIGFAITVSLVGWGAYARAINESITLNPPPVERKLLAYLETLPKDVLLAGTPCALDNVPLFAKRQILFSCEQLSPDEDLMREALDAYYAEQPRVILDFCQTYGVDYLVINRLAYTQAYLDRGWIFFEPYNQELLPRVKARDSFALAQVPDEAKVFESDGLFVVPCTRSALEG